MVTRAALWLRVSSSDQDANNQRPALEALAERRGWEVVTVYELAGESAFSGGGAGYRQALAAMLADARAGRFEVLACWSLDRLSRQGPLATLGLVDRLGRSGVTVSSLQEPWTEAPGELRELLLAIAAWVARMESHRRSERTRAGLARAKAAGVRLGRPPGARDKGRRRRSGYLLREARKRGG
ncbi:MAG: recombinase family protein [Candidatus Dormibacteria bacterium]